MNAIKGPTPAQMKVVPHRPYYRLLVTLGLIVGFVVVGAGSYWFGHYQAVALEAEAVAERDRLRQDLQAKVAEAEALSQQVANLRLASEVDKASSEDVRNQVIELKEQIAGLEEDIAFYRGLMAPTESRKGLSIGSVDVISSGMPRQYDFKVVVQQLATNHQVLSGYLNVEIVGQENGERRTMSLHQLSPQIEQEDIKLRFRYFQNIEGQIDLPPGFEPERIELRAVSTGKNGETVEERFGWLVHESAAAGR